MVSSRGLGDVYKRQPVDFALDARTLELREQLTAFMDEHVYPIEASYQEQLDAAPDVWAPPPIIEPAKEAARSQGLWNLFLPGEDGAGLTNLQYAPLCEVLGRSLHIAPVATNCAAPDLSLIHI